MFIAYVVVSIVLALMLAGSVWAKLTRNDRVVTGVTGLGVPLRWLPFLAACELAGTAGLSSESLSRRWGSRLPSA